MSNILGNFGRLAQFGGRERRGRFWPYVGVVFALFTVIWCGFVGAIMMQQFAGLETLAATHPEAVVVESGPGYYSAHVQPGYDVPFPDMTMLAVVGGLLMAGVVALLAAAVSRRLHDSGLSGWWGLLPVPFVLGGMVGFGIFMNSFMSEADPGLNLFFMLFFNNIIYMVTLLALIIMLCRPTAPESNRHGPPSPRD